MKNILRPLGLILTLTLPALAADGKVITLKDGSRVKGNVVSMDNGFYVIESPSMGEVRIADSNIASIAAATFTEEQLPQDQAPAAAPIPANITATPEFKSIQAKVMSDPNVMGDIQQMIQDPEIMAVLSDPSFVAAIQSGNMATLQTDPRLKHLSENPKIQAMIEKIKARQ